MGEREGRKEGESERKVKTSLECWFLDRCATGVDTQNSYQLYVSKHIVRLSN